VECFKKRSRKLEIVECPEDGLNVIIVCQTALPEANLNRSNVAGC
jgi:hypothetical protein